MVPGWTWTDVLTCFWEFFLGGCPCLWVLCCLEAFLRLLTLLLEAFMEASEVLGTEDLVTNTRDPEFSLDSTISTQTSSEELVGASGVPKVSRLSISSIRVSIQHRRRKDGSCATQQWVRSATVRNC